MKRIGVLTSGGDAPGMNAAVRAVVRTACENNMEVVGILRGYSGLIRGNTKSDVRERYARSMSDIIHSEPEMDLIDMNIRSVSDIIHRGGTILYTARCEEFKTQAGVQKGIETCKKNNIEGIVVIGGDGSFRGARDLSLAGIPCIGIPGTIDNDIACTDYTIGYDTCLNTIMDMVDRVRDTTESHDRCSVIEVMGRKAGFLALNAGIAIGATTILVPEFDYDIERDVIDRMRRTQKTGKRHFIIVVAEGIGGVEELARKIEHDTGVESRAVILGHVQRGGAPTCKDRVVASQMGNRAVKLLLEGKSNRVIGMRNEQIFDMDIYEALSMTKTIDRELFEVSKEISI